VLKFPRLHFFVPEMPRDQDNRVRMFLEVNIFTVAALPIIIDFYSLLTA